MLLNDSIDRISRIFELSAAGYNQFAGTKQKNHHFRIRCPVDEAGKLLGLHSLSPPFRHIPYPSFPHTIFRGPDH